MLLSSPNSIIGRKIKEVRRERFNNKSLGTSCPSWKIPIYNKVFLLMNIVSIVDNRTIES